MLKIIHHLWGGSYRNIPYTYIHTHVRNSNAGTESSSLYRAESDDFFLQIITNHRVVIRVVRLWGVGGRCKTGYSQPLSPYTVVLL